MGKLLGLADKNGVELKVGDKVKKPVTMNKDLHGEYAIYEIVITRSVPVLFYIRSEKEAKIPEGYMATVLSDEYDIKSLLWSGHTPKAEKIEKWEE